MPTVHTHKSRMRHILRHGRVLAAFAAIATASCSDMLNVKPVDTQTRQESVVGPTGARAAVAGIYDGLQDGSYYGGDFVFFTDVSSDDVLWWGTFTSFQEADGNRLRADNSDVESMWNAIYANIARANFAIQEVPNVAGMTAHDKNHLVGEARFLRALMYHDLVKTWADTASGSPGVPLILTPASGIGAAGSPARATVGQVYTQILADLTAAETLMDPDSTGATHATVGAAQALRARVELFRGNYAAAESLSTVVINSGRYSLASRYSDLFTADGAPTSEDIFRVAFTAVDYQLVGYYYLGRYEITPEMGLIESYPLAPTFDEDSPYETFASNDARAVRNFTFDEDEYQYGVKFPTTAGSEDLHVLRLAEMYLIRAEARARMGVRLPEAVDDIETVKMRSDTTAADQYVWGGNVTNAAEVLAAVFKERRLEFAMEGHRWFDMKRSGEIDQFLIDQQQAPTQKLYPIPQSEITVSPQVTQNPGY